ncbi:MAG: HAMP domain-containing protein [Leadbetterella sp.]|nr:HAMP domain-containing protein [Leadbetterella sp.]
MNTDFFQISPVSIAPLAELMFSLVITFYFLSVRYKTFDTRLITVYSGITTCMFALNFITTATLQSAYGPGVENLQYIIVACLSVFTVLFAYLFGGNPFKKEMVASLTLMMLLFTIALYKDKIAFPHILPVYVLTAIIVIAVFLRKARRSVQTEAQTSSFARETLAYRGFATCFLFYLLINLTASMGAAGIIPPAWWMLMVQVFIYAFLFTFFISYLNYTGAAVSFVTRVAAVLLYFNLMILGALGLVLFGVEMPGESGRRALNILAVLIPVSTLGIVIFVPLFLRRSLLKPLQRVLDGMKRVDTGDLSREVPVTTHDEIGTLTENFNRMTRSLRIYTSQMESLVAERTNELYARQKKLENTLEQLEETQQKLKRATEQKNRFFDNITHELKTPLTLILAPVEHLAASAAMREKTDLQAIRLIDRNAKNLLTLVNHLLDLSKIESGELTLRPTPGIISRETRMVVNDFLVFAGRKSVDIRYENLIPEVPFFSTTTVGNKSAGTSYLTPLSFVVKGALLT